MPFGTGLRVLRRMCEEQNTLLWQNSKLTPLLFKPHELPAFFWVENHLKKHHALPKPETLFQAFPDAAEGATPEPVSY